jgi:hypothetical protein
MKPSLTSSVCNPCKFTQTPRETSFTNSTYQPLATIYEAGKKVWMADYFDEDEDGGNLAYNGRVMEILSEHTCEVRIITLLLCVELIDLGLA